MREIEDLLIRLMCFDFSGIIPCYSAQSGCIIQCTDCLTIFSFQILAIAGIAMTLDFYICYYRPALKRLCHGMLLYGVIYTIWSVMWSLSGLRIYFFLDWLHDTVYAMIAIVVLAIISQTTCLTLWFTKSRLLDACLKTRHIPGISGMISVPHTDPVTPEVNKFGIDKFDINDEYDIEIIAGSTPTPSLPRPIPRAPITPTMIRNGTPNTPNGISSPYAMAPYSMPATAPNAMSPYAMAPYAMPARTGRAYTMEALTPSTQSTDSTPQRSTAWRMSETIESMRGLRKESGHIRSPREHSPTILESIPIEAIIKTPRIIGSSPPRRLHKKYTDDYDQKNNSRMSLD